MENEMCNTVCSYCWKTFISKFSYKNAIPGFSVGITIPFKTLCGLLCLGSSGLGS